MELNYIWMDSTVPVQRNLHIYLFFTEITIHYGTLLVYELDGNNCPIGGIATFFDPIFVCVKPFVVRRVSKAIEAKGIWYSIPL